MLQNLGQILPSKLEYLGLTLHVKTSDFEIFLKNSQNTFVKKLVIHTYNNENIKNILYHLKRHIVKKKRIEYLAIYMSNALRNTTVDLFSLKDEVEEFKLNNIIVQSFKNLYIIDYNFIKGSD